MNKLPISKLHSFITKLMILLEDELDIVKYNKSKNTLIVKKNIIDMLYKVVNLISQLDKLNKENITKAKIPMSEKDEDIIANFLAKYHRTSDDK
jgi:hypothetical protein